MKPIASVLLVGGIGAVAYLAYRQISGASLSFSVPSVPNPFAPGSTLGPLTSTSGQKGDSLSKSLIDLRYLNACPNNQLPVFDKNGAMVGCSGEGLPANYTGTSSGAKCIPLGIVPFVWPLLLLGSKVC